MSTDEGKWFDFTPSLLYFAVMLCVCLCGFSCVLIPVGFTALVRQSKIDAQPAIECQVNPAVYENCSICTVYGDYGCIEWGPGHHWVFYFDIKYDGIIANASKESYGCDKLYYYTVCQSITINITYQTDQEWMDSYREYRDCNKILDDGLGCYYDPITDGFDLDIYRDHDLEYTIEFSIAGGFIFILCLFGCVWMLNFGTCESCWDKYFDECYQESDYDCTPPWNCKCIKLNCGVLCGCCLCSCGGGNKEDENEQDTDDEGSDDDIPINSKQTTFDVYE